MELANTKKSIYYSKWGVKPAAFYLGLQFKMVMDFIKYGSLYNVIREEPKKKSPTWFMKKNKVENFEYIPREDGITEVEFEDTNK